MVFRLFIPYQGSVSESKELDGYYASEEDYVAALQKEESENGSVIFNAMASGDLSMSPYYGHGGSIKYNVEDIIEYASSECTLYSPNGSSMETVDSMIDKFVSQREFLVTAQFNMSSMDGEFEEELRQWNIETGNILKYAGKMGEEWVNKNIPRRDLRLSFLNKSNKEVKFVLENSEIEEKLSKNRYLLYVNKMQILK